MWCTHPHSPPHRFLHSLSGLSANTVLSGVVPASGHEVSTDRGPSTRSGRGHPGSGTQAGQTPTPAPPSGLPEGIAVLLLV